MDLSIFSPPDWGNAAGTATNHVVDAATDGWAAIFAPPYADAITHVWFRYGARTGTPPVFSIRLEGVTSGDPDGSDIGGGSPTAATFTPPADATWDGTGRWIALTNSFTPTRGQMLAITIRHSSGTIDGSNNSSFTTALAGLKPLAGFPLMLTLTAGAWAKVSQGACYGYRTASGRYGYIATGSFSSNVNTDGHRSAMHFTVPDDWGIASHKILRLAMLCRTGSPGNSFIAGLWDGAGSVIQNITMDNNVIQAPTSNQGVFVPFDEVSLTDLTPGTKYYAGIQSVSGSIVGLRGWQLSEADDRSWLPNGLNRGFSNWNGSAWTDDNTVMPCASLVLDEITAEAGGGGGFIPHLVGAHFGRGL